MDWKKFFDSIGMDGTRWQWKMIKLQERWESFRSSGGTRASNATYQHRLCGACGGLIDRDSTLCPRCGAKLEHWRRVQIRRAAGMIIPGGLTLSYLLVAVNLVALLAFLIRFGFSNLLQPNGLFLGMAGGLMPDLVAQGEWWRLVSYAFLHAGILHILFNMSALSQVGPVTENEIGRARFWVVYFLCAISGALADVLWHAQFHSRPLVVGASGAIFGLIGFGLTYNHFHGGHAGRMNSRVYLQWAVYGFAFGFIVGGIDNVCHAGGFIAGAFLGWFINLELRHGDRFSRFWNLLATICGLIVIVALVMAAIQSFRYGVPEALMP